MGLLGFLGLKNKNAAWIVFLTIGFFIFGSRLVHAQAVPEITQQLLQKLEERDRKITERDALIADLQKRVEQLERLAGTASSQQLPPKEKQPSSTHPMPKSTVTATTSRNPVQQAQVQDEPRKDKKKNKKAAAPGAFEVDEDAAERALERTLTQVGALLLPFGLMEIQPYFTYSRLEQTFPALVSTGGGQALINAEILRNQFTPGVFTRIGLPFNSQFELNLPSQIMDQTTVGYGRETNNMSASFGDMTVGIAKTLFRERNWLPDLVARVTWDTGTGQQFNNGTLLGSGFNHIYGSLTALKRQDPLVFTSTVFYQSAFEEDGIRPGDQFGFSIGTLLAASPQTSLRLGLQQVFSQKLEINGNAIPGSGRVISSFILGASSILGRGILLSVSAGIGLTESAPDYFINFSLPIRFGIPFM